MVQGQTMLLLPQSDRTVADHIAVTLSCDRTDSD
jgi:hypothetical protein